MYLRDISNLVIKNITALYRIDCGLREWVCRSCMNILGWEWFRDKHFVGYPRWQYILLPSGQVSVTFKAPRAVHVSISTAWKQMK